MARAGGPTSLTSLSRGAGVGKDRAAWACLRPRRSEGKIQESSPRWHPTGDPGMELGGGEGAGRSGKTISFLTQGNAGGGGDLHIGGMEPGEWGGGFRREEPAWPVASMWPSGGCLQCGGRGEKLVRGRQERVKGGLGQAGQLQGQMFTPSRFTHVLTLLSPPRFINLEPSSNFPNKFIIIAINTTHGTPHGYNNGPHFIIMNVIHNS